MQTICCFKHYFFLASRPTLFLALISLPLRSYFIRRGLVAPSTLFTSLMKKLLFAALLLCLTTAIQAQRYGHLNFSGLLAIMPESAAAEAELQTLNDQLVAEGEEMANTLQQGVAEYQAAEASQEKSPLELQAMVQALQTQQQALTAFEQNAGQQLEEKRMELLQPVVEQAQTAVNEVAQENGFVLVFDTGVFNAILFAQESEDLMPLVKAKLGLE